MHGYINTITVHTFHRGRQRLPGYVARTDAPVYMREGGGDRGRVLFLEKEKNVQKKDF